MLQDLFSWLRHAAIGLRHLHLDPLAAGVVVSPQVPTHCVQTLQTLFRVYLGFRDVCRRKLELAFARKGLVAMRRSLPSPGTQRIRAFGLAGLGF